MALSKEQVSELKKQLLNQISHLPKDQKKEAENQIEELSDEAIESILESQKSSEIKIFREIVSGKIPSKKIDESNKAIAVLEIKPISKGHSIIIPKEPINKIEEIPQEISKFTEAIAEIISNKLNVKNIKIIPEIKFGEAIINLIPLYDKDLSLESPRSNPSEDELEKILEIINKPQVKEPETKKIEEELKKFPRRIP